jgi:ornithine cyclodeaminase/alanine dehydrogenase-like protein (mu-crystallin family)
MAVCAVRPIETIRCYSPNPVNREAFAKTMTETLGVPVKAVGSPDEAFAGADILMCASNSIENIFFEQWVRPGVHVNSIKRQEVEVAAMKRADRIAIHTNDWHPLHYETEDFVHPERVAIQKAKDHNAIDFTTLPTLAKVIAGKVEGRTSDEQVTCFINNQGMGFQFAATGAVLYQKAKQAGAGHNLPTDWFTEVENN